MYSQELDEVTFQDFPMPPVARTTDGACEDDEPAGLAPVAETQAVDSTDSPSLSSSVTVHSMKTSMPIGRCRCCSVRISLQAGAVTDVGEPGVAVPPEVALEDQSLGGAVEQRTPLSSSSRTRSGASWACSSAIRQWFSSFPPRMVSRKCTFQLSSL